VPKDKSFKLCANNCGDRVIKNISNTTFLIF
jgi:hypothetical protein